MAMIAASSSALGFNTYIFTFRREIRKTFRFSELKIKIVMTHGLETEMNYYKWILICIILIYRNNKRKAKMPHNPTTQKLNNPTSADVKVYVIKLRTFEQYKWFKPKSKSLSSHHCYLYFTEFLIIFNGMI